MAFTIRDLKIREQILLVTLPPLFALLCAVGLFLYAYWSATRAEMSAARTRNSVAVAESVLRHATEASVAVDGYVLTHQKEMLDPYDKAVADVEAGFVHLRESEQDDPGRLAEVLAVRAEFDQMQKQWALPAIEQVRRHDKLPTVAVVEEGNQRMTVFREKVLALLEESETENARRMKDAEANILRMVVVGIGLAALLGCLLLFLTSAVTDLIVRPVLQLIHASEQVERGNVQPPLPPMVNNEFGVLSSSFSKMTTALRSQQEEMAALNRFSLAVTQCSSEREVHERLVQSLKQEFQPRQVMIFNLNQAENFLEVVATLTALPAGTVSWPAIEDPHDCKAIRTGCHFSVNDVTREVPCPSHFVLPVEGSYYCGPLVAGGYTLGSVRIEAAKDVWTPKREQLLESYLSGAASALYSLRLRDSMKKQANQDVLTGLHNRRFLEGYAQKQFAVARRHEGPLGLIMMDLDHFKNFNDVYGHEIGDRVLRHFARTITGSMREANLAVRYGGEEFVVMLPDTDAKGCLLVAERIRKAVMLMVVPSNTEKPLPQVTVSMGVAVFPEHGLALEELIQASDEALYESKRNGRNRVTLYTPHETPSA